MNAHLDSIRRGHIEALDGFFKSASADIEALADACAEALKRGNKLIFCGNGGSACDAMHIAGEFVGRFIKDRPSLPALALSADSGLITCIANDYGYDQVFSRQIEGLGVAGDVLIGLSTSGSSQNVMKAIEAAKKKNILTVLITGEKGKENKVKADRLLVVPSTVTAHVQEATMVALHGMTGLIESKLGQ